MILWLLALAALRPVGDVSCCFKAHTSCMHLDACPQVVSISSGSTSRRGKGGGEFTGNRTWVSKYPAQRANHCTMNSAQRATSQWADTVLRAIIGDNLIRHLGFVKHCLQVSVLWCSCINHNAKRCSCFAIIISKNVILYRTYLLNTVRWMLAIASRCC